MFPLTSLSTCPSLSSEFVVCVSWICVSFMAFRLCSVMSCWVVAREHHTMYQPKTDITCVGHQLVSCSLLNSYVLLMCVGGGRVWRRNVRTRRKVKSYSMLRLLQISFLYLLILCVCPRANCMKEKLLTSTRRLFKATKYVKERKKPCCLLL